MLMKSNSVQIQVRTVADIVPAKMTGMSEVVKIYDDFSTRLYGFKTVDFPSAFTVQGPFSEYISKPLLSLVLREHAYLERLQVPDTISTLVYEY